MSIRLPELVASIVESTMSPHPVDRYLEFIDPMLTWRDLRAKVARVDRPTPRTVRLTLTPTRQWRGHKAGQFVQLGVVIDGVRQTRCFSPANATQTRGGTVELTITVPDDPFVAAFVRDHAAIGDVYTLTQAAGEFTLPAGGPVAPVFISGGSGITPVLSMLRTLVAEGFADPITFVHYARGPEDVAYGPELAAIASAHPNVDLRIIYTRGTSGAGAYAEGHFHPDHLDRIAGQDDADVFVCGPATLMDAVTDHYASAHPRARVHSEAFTIAAPIVVDPNEPITGEVAFTASGTSAANDGRTILDQAESAGLSPASGCRMGICFSCTAVKKSGCTRNVLTGELDTESETQIQICVNAPVGNVEIEV
ncbi:MAG: ferredoxin reductase [Gordonia sp. (in: high G+C Gram-positive bacteria)]